MLSWSLVSRTFIRDKHLWKGKQDWAEGVTTQWSTLAKLTPQAYTAPQSSWWVGCSGHCLTPFLWLVVRCGHGLVRQLLANRTGAGGCLLTAASPIMRGTQVGTSRCLPHHLLSGLCYAYSFGLTVLLTWWVKEGLASFCTAPESRGDTIREMWLSSE